MSSPPNRTLIELDSHRPGRIAKTIGLTAIPYRLISGGGALWLANGFDGAITRVAIPNAVALPAFQPEPNSTGRLALAFGNESIWSAAQDGTVTRIDPRTQQATAMIRGISNPEAVAVGGGAVWVGQATNAAVIRIDPRNNRRVASIPIGGFATAIATSPHAVWILTPAENRVWRIDPRTNAVVASIDIGINSSNLLATPNAIWVVSDSNGTLTRIEPTTNQSSQTVQLGHPLGGSTTDGKTIWVTIAG